MINLNQVKSILQTAGISQLKIDFDDDRRCVNAEYVFRGTRATKKITYQEIVDSLLIGLPDASISPAKAITR